MITISEPIWSETGGTDTHSEKSGFGNISSRYLHRRARACLGVCTPSIVEKIGMDLPRGCVILSPWVIIYGTRQLLNWGTPTNPFRTALPSWGLLRKTVVNRTTFGYYGNHNNEDLSHALKPIYSIIITKKIWSWLPCFPAIVKKGQYKGFWVYLWVLLTMIPRDINLELDIDICLCVGEAEKGIGWVMFGPRIAPSPRSMARKQKRTSNCRRDSEWRKLKVEYRMLS